MKKQNIGKYVERGVGAFGIIMGSKLVSIGCVLFTGIMHIIDPVGGLNFVSKLLAGFVALYAILSFFFVLSNKNNKNLEKGIDFASGLVRGVIEDNKDPLGQGQVYDSKNREFNQLQKDSNKKWDDRIESLFKKSEKEPKAGRIALCILYGALFVGAVILFFRSDVTFTAIHIIIGGFLITDGVSGISAILAARKNGVPLKEKKLSFIANVFSVVLGVAFILMAQSMAEITMVIGGITLLIKGLTDLFVMIRNREVFLSVKRTLNEIKQQGTEEQSVEQSEKTENSNKAEEA